MSVSFNTNHDNMAEILKESKLGSLLTKNEYRCYGLAQESNNPPLLISAQDSMVTLEQEKFLIAFLKKNRIQMETEDVNSSDKKIYIGIRRDLRDHVGMCAALFQTIIYYLEKRVEIPENFDFGSPQAYAYKEEKATKE